MTPWGAGHAADLAAGDLSVRVLTRGATLRSVRLRGVDHDLTVGADDPALYAPDGPLRFHGAMVGPVANRLRGAQAEVAGRLCRFEADEGAHLLHSGRAGMQYRIWDVLGRGPDTLLLGLGLPDGEGGFPGNRRVTARWSVRAPATLRLEIRAATDAPTLWNPASHAYWTLDGGPTWEGHVLRLAADRVLPTDAENLPTGEVRPVEGTPFDLRQGRAIRPGAPRLDHNFCLGDGPGPLREVAWLTGRSGVSLVLATTAPGLQVYDGGHAARPGAALFEALALEPQMWPDAPAHPHFPAILLRPGEGWSQITEWRFAR
ncbi:aldose epimerase family protein [Rubellimicrobium sp. CFH 75288]|uniref:aldose epimerase family protein n=1 Tax=Rubellimicrobium sp. CFH 75288 TaxID=2697034 RepID=UPI0014136E6E|nr:galactose mutarotase [Rubellimicrobium sp. CFH 75288]